MKRRPNIMEKRIRREVMEMVLDWCEDNWWIIVISFMLFYIMSGG